MGELNNIFSKLNIMEQAQLNKYINIRENTIRQEANKMIDEAKKALEEDYKTMKKYYEDINSKTWGRVQTALNTSMREHHVSYERMESIYKKMKEINQNENMLIGEEQKSEYKILQDSDFQKMIELLMDSNCKNCHSRNYKCEVYGLLKKYNIPQVNGKCKCKYGYLKIGKKVV